jgi:glutamate-1-semialdehyde 2,1-aminomutase
MFRLHLRDEPPTTYREAYLEAKSKTRLGLFVNGLLDHGIIVANTGTGFLSTVMGEAQIAKLAEAVFTTLRGLPPAA